MEMRALRLAALVAALAVAALHGPQGITAGGGDEGPAPAAPGGISKERPFLAAEPDYDGAKQLCRKANSGDKEAVAKFKAGGLTYVPHMGFVVGTSPLVSDALWEHIDWVRAMQGWEARLVCGDPRDLPAAYDELKPRFRIADTQLARAVLYAWHYGDLATMDALVAKNPESRWVKAAVAWTGRSGDDKANAETLLEMVTDSIFLWRLDIRILRSQLCEPEVRLSPLSDESEEPEVRHIGTADGVPNLRTLPIELMCAALIERSATYVSRLGNKEIASAMHERLVAALAPIPKEQEALASRFLVISNTDPTTVLKLSDAQLELLGYDGTGAGLGYTSMLHTTDADAIGGPINAATAFVMAPDHQLVQRTFLARFFNTGEDVSIRAAARALVALRSQRLESYRNIGRGLLKFCKTNKSLLAAYIKVLAESGNDDLKKQSALVSMGMLGPLEAHEDKALQLSETQLAGLIAPFVSEIECKTCASLEVVLWLDRARMAEASSAFERAWDCYVRAWLARQAARKDMEPEAGSLVSFQFWRFLQRAFGPKLRQRRVADIEQRFGPTTKQLTEQLDALNAFRHDLKRGAGTVAFQTLLTKDVTFRPKELVAELSTGIERWGATGLALARAWARNHKREVADTELHRLAEELGPMEYEMHLLFGPIGEAPGSLSAGNWVVAQRHANFMALLNPLSVDTGAVLTSLLVRRDHYLTWHRALANFSRLKAMGIGSGYSAMTFLPMMPYRPYDAMHMQERWLMALEVQTPNVQQLGLARELWAGHSRVDYVRFLAAIGGPHMTISQWVLYDVTSRWDQGDVNMLLNEAYNGCICAPQASIDRVAKADKIGVSKYGRFVGTQGLCGAHALLGTFENVEARYHEMRSGRVGTPHALDGFLCAGAVRGNNHAQAEAIRKAILKYDLTEHTSQIHAAWRALHMMAGCHSEISALPLPENEPPAMATMQEYSLLFHEARALLDKGDFKALLDRTQPHVDGLRDELGVLTDAVVMRALARHELGKDAAETPLGAKEIHDRTIALPGVLDSMVLAKLAGLRAEPIPAAGDTNCWHGALYSERPCGFMGGQRMTLAIAEARDPFIRGLLAYLDGDKAAAREKLKACVDANVRSSHEYHVAEWLLANRLKE
ncbi:MAG: hypothetical protein IT463_09350 [Planctomycetes bacterium]|nr:hypothetical protein [Planctomycetota bacterium]